MGYSTEHRLATRTRILDAAARIFRDRGYAGASIDDIMSAAGLTRGGFYSHFKSKQDLFRATMGEELEFTKEIRSAVARDPEHPELAAEQALAYYLDPGNRKKIARGCSVVSNAADMARSSLSVRRAFTKVFRHLVEEFEALAHGDEAERSSRALSAIATCVGGVVLARALADEKLVEDLLGASLEQTTGVLRDEKRKNDSISIR